MPTWERKNIDPNDQFLGSMVVFGGAFYSGLGGKLVVAG